MATKIYTRTGDDGSTGLLGGKRISKSSELIDVIGVMDELNAVLGVALSYCTNKRFSIPITKIQSLLFEFGGELSAEPGRNSVSAINEDDIKWLEDVIDDLDEKLPPLKNFILPGGSKMGANLHFARAICCRAERSIVNLPYAPPLSVRFFNRLSDVLFVMARLANIVDENEEQTWQSKNKKSKPEEYVVAGDARSAADYMMGPGGSDF